MSGAPALEIEHLVIEADARSGRRRLVDGVDLVVDRGEAVGLVGESGSGKSMTLRAIMGLLPPGVAVVDGAIRVQGDDVLGSGPHGGYRESVRGSGVSMVFQEPAVALNPIMRVGRQISDAVARRKRLRPAQAKSLAVELMRDVGIDAPESRVDDYPFELSGGMRQRVMIAAAVAQEPRLLLCDEPTTALDVTIQAQVLALFEKLRAEQGFGMLYVTHDLSVVAQLCSRIAVMRHGAVCEHGRLRAIFDAPSTDYTKRLLEATPRLRTKAEREAER